MRKPASGAILDHLTRRRPLSSVEQKWIDLDGDGRITSRDLLLLLSGVKPTTLPAFVPETRLVRPGEALVCTVFGAIPPALRARAAVNGRVVDLPITIRAEKSGTCVEIALPTQVAVDKGPQRIAIWIASPGRLPRSVVVTVQETQA